ncbi:glycosyltransferase [Myxosarcina sp. GI1]|uniref:glycosyltransferase n=1 Tax=Myxosarcina sp. GI1 TaxID=1541065 RepID=UPI00055DFEC9|nr:glycosyltransferase [Myxosarcina sp. GI1]
MKIAIITACFLPLIDGVTVSGLQRLQKLSQWGHEVLLFCPDYSSLAKDYPNWRDYTGNILPGVRIVNLESDLFVGLEYELNPSRRSYKTVLAELEKFQPDIVHVDEPERLFVSLWRVAGVDYAKRAGIPCISFFRTNFLDYVEDYFKLPGIIMAIVRSAIAKMIVYVYNSYDLTLVTSQITEPKVRALGIKNTLHSNLVGFDAERFKHTSPQANFFEQQYGITRVDEQIKLVFLGRLYPDKGWNFTLRVFPTIASKIDLDRIAIIIMGDGPMRQEIADKLGKLTPHVHFLGRISPQDVPAVLVNCDLHVTTSEKETRGLTILEALAAGIPVLAPRAGGVVENIENGKNGFLYTPQDEEDFANKLQTLVENKALRKEMGTYGKQTVDKYSWDNSIRNLVEIWEQQIALKSTKKRQK